MLKLAGVAAALVLAIVAVVIIVNVPAAKTAPWYQNQRTMRRELQDLAAAEQNYFSANRRYSSDLTALGFTSRDALDAPIISLAGAPNSWSATLTHKRDSTLACAIAEGVRNPVDSAAPSATPACRRCGAAVDSTGPFCTVIP